MMKWLLRKRIVAYACLILLLVVGFSALAPVLPVIQVAGEVVVPWPGGTDFLNGWFGGGLTNTFVATIITYFIVIAITLALRARSRTADEIPTGSYNLFEMLIEFAYGYVNNAAGKWTKNFFPFFMSFILLIIFANWLELVPGVDSIGVKEDLAHHAVEVAEHEAEAVGEELTHEQVEQIEAAAAEEGGRFEGPFLLRADEGEEAGKQIVAFVRVPATDLNFTIALALVSVAITQYYGFKALGAKYLKKFFNYSESKTIKNPLGAMDPLVGILELISEFAKILSFSFRLFGNIFAGQVLLFVIAFLLPLAVTAVYGLEFFVGAIQAAVFGLLTLTFMAGATQSHDDEH
jgi:F-type H+-transporting ATPase subunit a